MRAAARGAAALLAGGLVAASLPPFGWWPLALGGVALLAHVLAGRRMRERAVLGVLAGFGQFAPGCAWALHFTGVGYAGLVALEACFIAGACAIAPPGRALAPGLAAGLTLAEWARDSWPFGGVPLGGIALGQANGPFLVLARLGGPLLVAGAVLTVGAALGTGLRRLTLGHGPGLAATIGALALVGAVTGLAAVAPAGGPVLARADAVAVQGGGRRGFDAAQVPTAVALGATLAESRRIRPGPALVLWPEDVVALDRPLGDAGARDLLAGEARRLRATLVAGVTAPAGPRRFDNELVALSPAGRIVATFEKVHRVPFGEYVPDRTLFSHLANLSAVPRDAVAGHASGMISTPAGRFALLVSFETFFPLRGRAGVDAGGEALLVATNTASYATSQVPLQELAASRLQAVSEGRDLLQAASTGISAAVSNDGRVLADSGLSRPDLVRVRLALRDGRTLYDAAGDMPVLALALGALGASWFAELGARRRARQAPPFRTTRPWRRRRARPRRPRAGGRRAPC